MFFFSAYENEKLVKPTDAKCEVWPSKPAMKLFSLLETSSEFFLLSAFRLSRMFEVPKMFCFCSILCVDVAFVHMCAFFISDALLRASLNLLLQIVSNKAPERHKIHAVWANDGRRVFICLHLILEKHFVPMFPDILLPCFVFFCLFGGLFLVWVGSRLAESLGVLGIFVFAAWDSRLDAPMTLFVACIEGENGGTAEGTQRCDSFVLSLHAYLFLSRAWSTALQMGMAGITRLKIKWTAKWMATMTVLRCSSQDGKMQTVCAFFVQPEAFDVCA